MDIRTETDATITTVHLNGEMNVLYAANTKTALLAAVDTCAPGMTLDIDLSGISEFDSAGLQLIALLRREADARELTLQFPNPSEAVKELLEVAGLTGILMPANSQPEL